MLNVVPDRRQLNAHVSTADGVLDAMYMRPYDKYFLEMEREMTMILEKSSWIWDAATDKRLN